MGVLSKVQANEVFKAVEAAGLSPDEFVWDADGNDTRLRHRSSGAHFVFGGAASKFVVRHAAGDEQEWELAKYTWPAVMTSVEVWLREVKRHADTPDLWAELRGHTELLEGVWDDTFENTPITPDEQGKIARQLREFREYVHDTHDLSEQQSADLSEKVDYLVEAASRVGRRDWLMMCVGAIVAYLLVAALPPDASRQIVETFISGIAQLLGHDLSLGGS